MIHVSKMSSRNQFGQLLTDMGLSGNKHLAVEIGTHRGEFAKPFLDTWTSGTLFCVDPWSVPAGYELQAEMLWGGIRIPPGDKQRGTHGPTPEQVRDDDFNATVQLLEPYIRRNRVRLRRQMSMEALQGVKDSLLNLPATESVESRMFSFVYVDGNHEPPHVLNDVQGWWTVLRSGGVLGGHDFLCPGEVGGGWGRFIQPAVLGFADKMGVDVYVVVEEGGLPWSYYMMKP